MADYSSDSYYLAEEVERLKKELRDQEKLFDRLRREEALRMLKTFLGYCTRVGGVVLAIAAVCASIFGMVTCSQSCDARDERRAPLAEEVAAKKAAELGAEAYDCYDLNDNYAHCLFSIPECGTVKFECYYGQSCIVDDEEY